MACAVRERPRSVYTYKWVCGHIGCCKTRPDLIASARERRAIRLQWRASERAGVRLDSHIALAAPVGCRFDLAA